MTTQQRIEVFGELIPVRRLNPMAHHFFQAVNGNKALTWAGFVWYRPQVVSTERPQAQTETTELRAA